MVNLQEHLNRKYPTKEEKEKVSTLYFTYLSLKKMMVIEESKNQGWFVAYLDEEEYKRVEGGELDLSDYVNLIDVRIDGDYLKTPLTKLKVGSCPYLTILICINNSLTSIDFLNSLLNPKEMKILNIYNNNIQPTNIEIFSRFINLFCLKIGTESSALKKEKHNKFYGSLKSYQNLTKLERICVEATDISDGLEYLPISLAQSTARREKEDSENGGYLYIECSPHNTNAKCKAIQDQLRPFNYDLEAWQLVYHKGNFSFQPWMFKRLEQKIITAQQEIQETRTNFPEKAKRIERLQTKLQNLIQAKASLKDNVEEPIEMDFLIITDKFGVKEELIKENIWNMRLEGWLDKESKQKAYSWVVEKKEFIEKNLFQNKVLASAISGERNKMVMLKVQEDDEKTKNTIRQLQGINITPTLLEDKNFTKEYQGYEAWLLEKDKVPNYY